MHSKFAVDRRSFLTNSLATGAAVWGSVALPMNASGPAASQIIDTHTHFYDPTRPQGVPWPGKGSDLYRRVLPADYMAIAKPLGITGTVVVEASAWVEDNQWLLDLADREPFLVGVVGNLMPGSDDFPKLLQRFAKHPKYFGLRINGKTLIDLFENATFRQHLKLMSDLGVGLDVNGGATMLIPLATVAKALPDLRIVINHMAGVGDTKNGVPAAWLDGLKQVAAAPRVFLKVSALIEMAKKTSDGSAPTDVDHYRPALDAVWETLGEDRLIYGTNWPVSDKASSLAAVHQLAVDYFSTKGKAVAEKFFWKNSQAAYRR